ncbi:MAG: nuclear transport factor 2 family protein [Bacteroidota bacterium]
MNTDENRKAILHCIELYNKCTLEWVDACYADKLEWIELPGPGNPLGRHGDFAFFHTSADQLLKLFPDRKLRVLKCIAENDCVVLEQEWQGTAAFTAGPYTAGRIARLKAASFFTLENGLIIKQTDYCVSGK